MLRSLLKPDSAMGSMRPSGSFNDFSMGFPQIVEEIEKAAEQEKPRKTTMREERGKPFTQFTYDRNFSSRFGGELFYKFHCQFIHSKSLQDEENRSSCRSSSRPRKRTRGNQPQQASRLTMEEFIHRELHCIHSLLATSLHSFIACYFLVVLAATLMHMPRAWSIQESIPPSEDSDAVKRLAACKSPVNRKKRA